MSDSLNKTDQQGDGLSSPLIRLQQISFGYPEHPVFNDVSLALSPGERLAIVGGNGSGKSTLLQLIVGLQQPSQGMIEIFGQRREQESQFREVRAGVGLLFQDSDDQLFCPTVMEDVAFGPLNLGKTRTEARQIALQTLTDLGLEAFAERITHKLSGGEKRLVALATVLAMGPKVLLLDEPTNGLDRQAEQRLVAHLESLDLAMILISHDNRLIEHLATRAMIMQDGALLEAVMHSHPHQHQHSHLHIHAAGIEASHQHRSELPKHSDHHKASLSGS